jgi:protein-tyrosine phosphatase
MAMVDIHCHILPGLDDGARDIEESIKMAKMAVNDGITDVIATPHTHNGIYLNCFDTVLESAILLQAKLKKEKIPLNIHTGSEIHIHDELCNNIQEKMVSTQGDTAYVLVELPSSNIPIFTDEVLDQLVKENFIPIIAHPERNLIIRDNPALLIEWFKQGIIVQITAGSLMGSWGIKVKEFSRQLIKHGFAQVLASDGHNATKRRVELKKAYRKLEKWFGLKTLLQLQGNALAILHGDKVEGLR